MNIKVKKSDINKRLDVYLSDKIDLSRSQIQKLIKQNLILVNGKEKSVHYKIRKDDKIIIKNVEMRNCAFMQKNKTLPKFKIIAETDDYLVINKPAGVIVHGGESVEEATLTDALEKQYPEIKKVGEDPLRPGIVHRLDKEASGLMVVVKNNKIFDHLKNQFQKRKTLKKYFALVYGQTSKEHDEINFPISRSAKGYKMAALPRSPRYNFGEAGRSSDTVGMRAGRNAITEFNVEQKFINYTLLDITIKTGRTHQIRVHMSAYGHPIVGDDLYGTKKTREQNAKLKLSRIFLHAHTLGFEDLNDEWQEFKIELPRELKEVLKKIK
ncbi:MAG: RluA family pseudouridine synthase [Patescibacteria group bacterium]|jgi:23S rRNA pseudouridine1911/1915/1917 synthase